MFYTRLIKNAEVWEFVTKVPLVAKNTEFENFEQRGRSYSRLWKNNLSDQIELDEVSVQSKEIRAGISQLRKEVKELTKLLKSQTS